MQASQSSGCRSKAEETAREGGCPAGLGAPGRGGGVQGPAAARAGATLAGIAEIPSVNSAPAAHRPQSPAGR